MAVLTAGGNISLTANNPLLREVTVGFGWNVIKGNGPVAEIVPSAIMCGADGKAIAPDQLVFFNQLMSPDGAVEYVNNGDVEQIEVRLNEIPESVQKIAFVVYVDPDIRKPGNFSVVREAYIRVADRDNAELVKFNIPNDTNEAITAMIFAELYRHRGEWKLRAIGQGYTSGLAGVAKDFGVQI